MLRGPSGPCLLLHSTSPNLRQTLKKLNLFGFNSYGWSSCHPRSRSNRLLNSRLFTPLIEKFSLLFYKMMRVAAYILPPPPGQYRTKEMICRQATGFVLR
uniref:Uncharacterized protein n=1 Tax=Magnetococcus massalia (strain MO-1) TaxID=451514 RepID=A0A1S7LFQ1_MAGMO|nr:protein of unknown function [Candidatus Magnetococcus massalia]